MTTIWEDMKISISVNNIYMFKRSTQIDLASGDLNRTIMV